MLSEANQREVITSDYKAVWESRALCVCDNETVVWVSEWRMHIIRNNATQIITKNLSPSSGMRSRNSSVGTQVYL